MAPTTRSSIRQSLGKAIADVISKEKEGDKASKKTKETRRLSAINLKPAAPRNSMGEIRPPAKRTETPDATLTRKRQSAMVQRYTQDDHSSKSNESTTQNSLATRSSALRPSSRQNTISSLPKYRPKSEVVKELPSPPRTSTRRRFQASEDEKEDQSRSTKPDVATTSSSRKARPISPLPLRALNRGPDVINPSPPSTPSRSKPATPSSARFSPTIPSRAPKAVKTATSSTAPQSNPDSPRSSSSSCSGTPRTPKTNATKGTSRRSERSSMNEKVSGTTTPSSRRFGPNSPSVHQQSRRVVDLTRDNIGNMSHISEATSDEEDVALLLAPVADPSAPTPAMPRLIKSRPRDEQPLVTVTPTRPSNTLPSRSQMSYLSPLPPDSPSFLRPVQKSSGDDRMFRGSIMSWEQMATEASKTLGEDEVHSMLADVPAPFGSVPMSPTASFNGMDIPDSPCLSALNSPGAFGSISQVLLPDVTPSPAVHTGTFKYDANNDIGPVDGAIVTLLRLQLVAVENTAKERLSRLQIMEEEMHNLKEGHKRETVELSTQLVRMQELLHEREEEEERVAVEKAAYTVSLEEQLREAKVSMQRVVQNEIARFRQNEQRSRQADLRLRHVVSETSCASRVAQACWGSVHDLSQAELEMVKGDRQLLSVVLAELDRMTLLVN